MLFLTTSDLEKWLENSISILMRRGRVSHPYQNADSTILGLISVTESESRSKPWILIAHNIASPISTY